ncbi:LADA_0D07294g1_1 [Lachancea dasiensis]|uniref:LADA_0D07294g1_1 n=1 Tax=Lachancea dasiensis TaxID=1072105 RepID=A0A1G4J6K7_9SACH|nr:LADA_0D07294g1_1 [Lachancea dasiensis]
MDPNGAPEMTEHQKIQVQFQLFQESLPKVDETVYRMLLNESIPLAIDVEKRLSQKLDSLPTEDPVLESLDKEVHSKLVLNPLKGNVRSNKLLQHYLTADIDYQAKVKLRLSKIGFSLGEKLSELLIFSNNPNFNFKDMDLLTVMKFLCRDVWRQLFGKQIDNLKTNHRGTFYLLDYNYKPVESFALEENMSKQEQTLLEPYLEIPCGVIQGVLASLGFRKESEVSCNASIVEVPESRTTSQRMNSWAVSFNVQVVPASDS